MLLIKLMITISKEDKQVIPKNMIGLIVMILAIAANIVMYVTS